MFNLEIKFNSYPTHIKLAIISLSLGWLVHLLFYYKFFTGESLARNDYLMFSVGIAICFFIAGINKWARPLCLFFNFIIIFMYSVLLYVYLQKPDFDRGVVSMTVLALFSLSTYLLLRRDTITYFKSYNEGPPAEGESKE